MKAFALIGLGLASAAMGIYVAHAGDKPGAAVLGFLLMVAALVVGVRTARNRLPTWARRTAVAVGVPIAVRGISYPCGDHISASLRATAGRAIGHQFATVAAI